MMNYGEADRIRLRGMGVSTEISVVGFDPGAGNDTARLSMSDGNGGWIDLGTVFGVKIELSKNS